MSAAEQLDLDALFGGLPLKPKRKEPATRFTCRCGRVKSEHAGKKNGGGLAITGCKKFRPKSKPPVEQPAHLAAPNAAIVLERDKAKRAPWTIGWATVDEASARIYLTQLKTKSLNTNFFGGSKDDNVAAGKRIRQRYAWQGKYKETCAERAASALLQCEVTNRGRPASIVLTRVCSGSLDRHDNLRGALKYVVDGIAEALGFNDAELDDSPARAGGSIHIRYAQEKCPQKVCGVRIEITWRSPT